MSPIQHSVASSRLYAAPEIIKGMIKWTAPKQDNDVVTSLRKAVNNADWGTFFAEKKTRTLASASWAASEERCEQLRNLCMSTGARRVLEIGSFVGMSTLSMAQVLPENGEIVSMEIDPFAVDFGLDTKVESDDFWKISPMVGPAWDSLQSLIQQMEDAGGLWEPFDLAIIDADKSGMLEYFEILTEIPGLMSDNYVIGVDVKPFKGQLCTQREDKNHSYLINCGQSEIDALRKHVASSDKFEFREQGKLLLVCKKMSYTMANNPFAAFQNCYSNASEKAQWAAPQQVDAVSELRKAVQNADWASLFAEGRTQILASVSWSASEERCEKLQALCTSVDAKEVLEIGSFCGVASLALAECLPEDGHVLSLEIDPYLVNFGQDIKVTSAASSKVSHMVGPALTSLKSLADSTEEKASPSKTFDFVVIDADKAGMLEYFKLLWETPHMLSEEAVVCIDVTPFKSQLFVPYVKGKINDYVIKSGQESIDSFTDFVKTLSGIDVSETNSLIIVQKSS
jgi:predicted O-methyltransferase YrrM